MELYKIDLENAKEANQNLVSALVSEEEAEIIKQDRFVKFVVNPKDDTVYCDTGKKTTEDDLVTSIARMIGLTYDAIKEDFDEKSAKEYRMAIMKAINDPEFWDSFTDGWERE